MPVVPINVPFYYLLFILLSFSLLFGCGSESEPSSNSADMDAISDVFPNSLTITEGQMVTVPFPKNNSVSSVSLSHGDEVLFYTYLFESQLRIVAPNIDIERNTSLTIHYQDAGGVEHSELIELIFQPVSLSLPDTLAIAYPFAGRPFEPGPELDAKGVPIQFMQGEYRYLPTLVAQYAYREQYEYLTRQTPGSLDRFLSAALWLKENCIYTEYGFCTHRFDIDKAAYEAYGDWPSAMAQGKAIYVLLAAGYYLQDIKYIETAYDALSAFHYLAVDKGVASLRGELLWYEEYASPTLDSGVLNGLIFGLAGVHTFLQVMPDNALAQQVFNNGIAVLKQELPTYDMGFSSYYNMYNNPLRPGQLSAAMAGSIDGYHEIHIFQLAWLYAQTNDDMFLEYAHLFAQYDFGQFPNLNYEHLHIQYKDVRASLEVAVEYGADNLIDTNWTYGRYWSSNEPNAEITLTVHEDILNTGHLHGVVMVFLDPVHIPNHVEVLYRNDNDEWVSVGTVNILANASLQETFQVGNFQSIVVKTDLDLTVYGNEITLRFDNSGLLALREINLLYDRVELVDYLIGLYSR